MAIESLKDELEKARAALKFAKDQINSLHKEVEQYKGAAAQAQSSELVTARFNELIAGINDGIIAVDEHGRIEQVNQEFCKLFQLGNTPQSLIGVDIIAVIESCIKLFTDPAKFADSTNKIIAEKRSVIKEELCLVSGQTFTRDHLPVMLEGRYKGFIWKYTDATRSKTIESTFESQRNFYEQILNNIPVSIAVFNPEHRYMYVNPMSVGQPELRKWMIGKNDEEYCRYVNKPLSLAEKRSKIFNDVVHNKTEIEWEEKFIVNAGDAQYHLRKMFPVMGPNGQPEMVIGYGIEITERKKIEEQIELGQKRYRDIFNFSQAWICTHDLQGRVLTINPAACEILEFEAFELAGKPISSLMPEKVREQFNDSYLTKIRVDGKADGIMSILNRKGKTIYLLYQNYLVNEPGSEAYVIGFAQNITQRIYTEEALKRSEEKYRGIIENMNLGMIEIDNEEHIIYANQRFCTMSGYKSIELTGKKATDLLLYGAGLKMTRTQLSKQQYGTAKSYELAIKTKTGEDRWWLSSATPLFNPDGSVKGTIGINLDITDQKLLEQQLKEAKQYADKSSISKDLFMTNMSHEIRTPLNAIMGLGKLLNKSELSANQKQYLAGIESASENLLGIINDLLDFSKIEAGKITIESISFNIEHVSKQAIDILTYKAEEKGLVLTQEIDSRIAPILMGDPYRINQVLMNMLSNAIKFTEKGSVTLHAFVVEEVEGWQKVQIDIKDTGVGINEKYLDNIFDKFTQEDETVVRKFGGTGLGMSITRQLMELMDGAITISSEKNKGTTISLTFNFKMAASRVFEKKKTIKNDTANIDNKRILLVEDNNLNRLLAYTILTDYGAEVIEAENGQEAVDIMRREYFDIILMDVQMPVMDGLQATRIIRNEINSAIPILALTANAIKGKEHEFFDAGMDDFIYKPYTEINLVNPIAKWLNKNPEAIEVTAPVQKIAAAVKQPPAQELPKQEAPSVAVPTQQAPPIPAPPKQQAAPAPQELPKPQAPPVAAPTQQTPTVPAPPKQQAAPVPQELPKQQVPPVPVQPQQAPPVVATPKQQVPPAPQTTTQPKPLQPTAPPKVTVAEPSAKAEPKPDEGPLYDISKLQSIGSDDFVKRMLKLFVDEVPSAVMNIKIAYDTNDFNTIKYLTHRIRPSIQNMGIAPLHEDVVVVEQLAIKGERSDDLGRRISKMGTIIDLVAQQLKKKYKL